MEPPRRSCGTKGTGSEPFAQNAAKTHDCEVPVPFVSQPLTVVLRVFDASGNRAREGLRVVEDYVRFVLDDRHLTQQCKQLRHDLAAALANVPREQCLAARETQADVGTGLSTPSEQYRPTPVHVLAANFVRLQEALRSLGEFGKLLNAAMADQLEQLRYRVYTLQRAVEITRASLQRLDSARLYVLLDGRSSPEELQKLAGWLVENGVDVLQLRDKQLDDRQLLARARLLRDLTHGTGTLLLLNDRPDLAALARADGVHLGQDDVSVKDARTIIGPDALIGVSTHSLGQARQAVLDGANYMGVGPTFPSGTKKFTKFPGVELLREISAEIRLPAFAIGGITLENLSEVLATGCTRIAVSGALRSAPELAARLIDRKTVDRKMS
jgi:thiamine-phosphate pyrophosphorylase